MHLHPLHPLLLLHLDKGVLDANPFLARGIPSRDEDASVVSAVASSVRRRYQAVTTAIALDFAVSILRVRIPIS
jgi:hypothetical protein